MLLGNDMDGLAHTKWRCQYHIVFAPKYRRQVIYGKYRQEIGKMICERNDVEVIQANARPGSYPYVGEHTAEDERVTVYGDTKGQDESNDT